MKWSVFVQLIRTKKLRELEAQAKAVPELRARIKNLEQAAHYNKKDQMYPLSKTK